MGNTKIYFALAGVCALLAVGGVNIHSWGYNSADGWQSASDWSCGIYVAVTGVLSVFCLMCGILKRIKLRSIRSGFTLIEMMITLLIISIIAGLMFRGLHWARQAACEARTKAAIAKLDLIVMERYESYTTRRLPIHVAVSTSPKDVAQMKLNALRDLMRMEMPERWTDVINDPVSTLKSPTLQRLYRAKYAQAITHLVDLGKTLSEAKDLIHENGGPECLYMFVSMTSPEAMENFRQDEIGDVDNDSLPEFVDGWGNPISFLRWAPGFTLSDIQWHVDELWNHDENSTMIPDMNSVPIKQRRLAVANDHDPFDTRKIEYGTREYTTTGELVPTGWHLIPLIYSAGPDKKYGINDCKDYQYRGNPYETIKGSDGYPAGIGSPSVRKRYWIGPGSPRFYDRDNITNHSNQP